VWVDFGQRLKPFWVLVALLGQLSIQLRQFRLNLRYLLSPCAIFVEHASNQGGFSVHLSVEDRSVCNFETL
jgi:hypothetical protein